MPVLATRLLGSMGFNQRTTNILTNPVHIYLIIFLSLYLPLSPIPA